DAVNIASRMESSGEPGRINISESTYALVKDKFTCEHRGKVKAKNKGEIDMYFIVEAIVPFGNDIVEKMNSQALQ
ncbi:MAG: adenylate/guanylate cyclase domain-containing protein, partial [Bacteroidia bacterium]